MRSYRKYQQNKQQVIQQVNGDVQFRIREIVVLVVVEAFLWAVSSRAIAKMFADSLKDLNQNNDSY
jgi:hypothetical protein